MDGHNVFALYCFFHGELTVKTVHITVTLKHWKANSIIPLLLHTSGISSISYFTSFGSCSATYLGVRNKLPNFFRRLLGQPLRHSCLAVDYVFIGRFRVSVITKITRSRFSTNVANANLISVPQVNLIL